ncbi:MAG: hypothetical protein J6C34_01840 [Oscillospiraceae bacterium]|nr:hypothetical protein [Oscillospiraceae bacterium]MBP3301726.1 hypothetical protein [Opitutales bacterium]
MEWIIKSFSRACAVSGVPFSDGDEVICFVCRGNDNDEVSRFDVLSINASRFHPNGKVIGQWKKKISSNLSKKIDFEQKLAYQEEFFFSLYEGEESNEKDILKQLFALLLEKKRILRSFGRKNVQKQKFVHIKSKKEFLVPVKDFSPEDLTSLENVFGMFA